MTKIQNLNPIALIVVVLVAGVLLGYFGSDQLNIGNLSSEEEAGKIALDFINKSIKEDVTASIIEIVDEGYVYGIRLDISGNEYYSYITKDGHFLFPTGFDLKKIAEQEAEAVGEKNSALPEVAKAKVPDVKLFVMSYCPYGLQMQKAFLPVFQLLGNKADMGVYFVDYIMHEKKEIDENLRQYCIEKEQPEKYYSYLNCFVEDGNYQSCLTEAGIDQQVLNSCVSATDKEYAITEGYNNKETWLQGTYPRFPVHSDLNDQYGVRGSPTVVINGQTVSVSQRSPENFKQIVCSSFETPPSECDQSLSDQNFSPGFGLNTASANSGGSCK